MITPPPPLPPPPPPTCLPTSPHPLSSFIVFYFRQFPFNSWSHFALWFILQGLPVRAHYFWPAFCQFRDSKNRDGKLEVGYFSLEFLVCMCCPRKKERKKLVQAWSFLIEDWVLLCLMEYGQNFENSRFEPTRVLKKSVDHWLQQYTKARQITCLLCLKEKEIWDSLVDRL